MAHGYAFARAVCTCTDSGVRRGGSQKTFVIVRLNGILRSYAGDSTNVAPSLQVLPLRLAFVDFNGTVGAVWFLRACGGLSGFLQVFVTWAEG